MDSAFHPRFEELPAEIAIFPLTGALLLPGGRLPLNIFEPRYLNMTVDALGQGRMFGMVQPSPQEPAGEAGPGLYRIGCLGRIASFSETEDGRFLITLAGVCRYRIAEELAMRRGYRRVRAEYRDFTADLDCNLARGTKGGAERRAIEEALRAYFRAQGLQANWEAIGETTDDALVASLCMICPFEAREKQALLEAQTPADRARMLLALLELGAHGQGGNPRALS
ncbi:MAG: LON peptidase substrate-binding domain-containing protein [Alphaproteobacteria bacterium]|nr:LON peptidase substrate-binding domain-containing protein [Alphaproteobacteria bacterium]